MVTEEQREQVIKLSRGPWDEQWIAEQVGVSPAEVRHVQKHRKQPAWTDTPYPPKLIGKVIDLARRKVDQREIATRLDIKTWKVHQILKEWMPIEKRQMQGRRGVRITESTKLLIRREYREFTQALSKRVNISERTLLRIHKESL